MNYASTLNTAYQPGEAWRLASEALKRGDVTAARTLLKDMLPSDAELMTKRIDAAHPR